MPTSSGRDARAGSAIIALAFLAAAALSGCGKDDPIKPKVPPFEYSDLSTPQRVVQNVKDSWERRDSVRTAQIYDDAYQGHSRDSNGAELFFTKSQEVATVKAMHQNQNIQSVHFNYQPPNTWIRVRYPTDPAGWTAIQVQGVNIQVDDVVLGTLLANSSSLFEFKFAPTLDSSSPTDTTWKIVRWEEIQN